MTRQQATEAALKYAKNHIINPENTDTADLLATINAALAMPDDGEMRCIGPAK